MLVIRSLDREMSKSVIRNCPSGKCCCEIFVYFPFFNTRVKEVSVCLLRFNKLKTILHISPYAIHNSTAIYQVCTLAGSVLDPRLQHITHGFHPEVLRTLTPEKTVFFGRYRMLC